MYKKIIKNVIGSLSFQIIPVFKKDEFFSHSPKKSWISLNKKESNEGKWSEIKDWSYYNNSFASNYFFTFQKNIFLSGMSFLINDINFEQTTEEFIIGHSLKIFNSSCEHGKFISGLLRFKNVFL